jgi:pimeloyl-ACP methyl ester carboxylesterase
MKDHLAVVIGKFTKQVGLKKFAVYVFDYGAPVGFRLALDHPERITAFISQNGNAYEEGLSNEWAPIRALRNKSTQENRDALRPFFTKEATYFQYTEKFTFLGRLTARRPEKPLGRRRHSLKPIKPAGAVARCWAEMR